MRNISAEPILVSIISAIAGAIATAIVNRLISTATNYWWLWIAIGVICALSVLITYRYNNSKPIKYGSRVAIQTDDKNFVTADLNWDNQLVGRASKIDTWQIYEIIDTNRPFTQEKNRLVQYGDTVAFKAINNGRFVGANLASEKQLNCWVKEVRGWEKFILCPTPDNASGGQNEPVHYGSSFALQMPQGEDKYVSYWLRGDGRLFANAPKINSWEKFTFINPTSLTSTFKKKFTKSGQ